MTKGEYFTEDDSPVYSYILSEDDTLRLADPRRFWDVLTPERRVDSLRGYDEDGFSIVLTMLAEFGCRGGNSRRMSWGQIPSPRNVEVVFVWDGREARKLQKSIRELAHGSCSSWTINDPPASPDDIRKRFWNEELPVFLARQADYFTERDKYLIMIAVERETSF